ncbi:MFS transporter [Modestobacter sp. VKM Ac-2986]|uniref:MFS transporter n=1 Tax=Modestobacter sp. VKM Ac-2986 TaxID=3004140 RepID=UPI0022AA1F71|nr:MFS transporter [Modestobacter sp. VKM Ac-2986]MCZ2828650.1 MFS transporter [Modestobacter sp. VKM Ac-2986]
MPTAERVSLWRLPAVRAMFAVSLLGLTSYSVLLAALPAYAADAGAGLVAAGSATTVFLLVTVLVQGTVPALVRRWGLGPVLAAGLVALGAPAPLYLAGDDVAWLLAVSAVRGVGFAVLTVLGSAIAAQAVPPERRGESIGIYGLGAGLPTLVAVPGGAALTLAGHFPWVAALGASAVLALPFVPGLVRALGPPPADAGPGTSRAAVRASAAPSLVLLTVTLAGGGLVTFLPIERPDGATATAALLVFGVSTAVCRWRVGVLVDRIGARVLLPAALGTGVAGLALVALGLSLAGPAGTGALLLGSLGLGVAYGAVQNLTLVVSLARAGEGSTATVSAVWNASFDTGTAIGALAVGAVAAGLGLPLTYLLVAGLLALVLPVAVAVARAPRLS